MVAESQLQKAAHHVGPTRITVLHFGGMDFVFRNTKDEGSFIVHTSIETGELVNICPWSADAESFWTEAEKADYNVWHVSSVGVELL